MTTPEAITRRETWDARWLWFGVLTGPVAWSIQLGFDWFVSEVVACSAGSSGIDPSIPLTPILAVVNVLLLAVTVVAGIVASSQLRSIRQAGDDTPGRREEWMARSGVIISFVFGLAIVASLIAVIMTSGCAS